MKRKKPPSAVTSDIRSFLPSPSPTRKPYTPIAHGGISTRSASAAARPGSSATTLPRGTICPKAAIIVDDNRYTNGASTQSANPSGCSPEPPVLVVRTSRKRRVARECSPRAPTRGSDAKESAEVKAVATKPARGPNKENGMCASTVNEPPPTPHQQTMRTALSEFYLVPIARGGAHGARGSKSSGYQLPLREVVVGRDSVRDSHKNNSNKLRIGIPNSEEGISRDQATLRVCSQEKRVLVMNKKAALNPIRIERQCGTAGISAEHHSHSASSSKGVSVILTAGKEGYLYPGDALELDAFRQRGRAKFRYVLSQLPPRPCEVEDSPDGDRPRTEVAAEVGKLSVSTRGSASALTVTKVPTTTSSTPTKIVPMNPLTSLPAIPARPSNPSNQSGAKLPSEIIARTPGEHPDTAAASVTARQLAASGASDRAPGRDEAPNLERGLDACETAEQEDGATVHKKPRTASSCPLSEASVCAVSPSSASARSSLKSADLGDPLPSSGSRVDLASAITGAERNSAGTPSKKLRLGKTTEIVPVEPPRDLTGEAGAPSGAPRSEGDPEDDADSSNGTGEEPIICEEVKPGNTVAVLNRAVKIVRKDGELSSIACTGVTWNEGTEGVDGVEKPPVLVSLSNPKAVLEESEGQVLRSPSSQAKCLTIDKCSPLAIPAPQADDAGQENCSGSSSPVAPDLPTSSTAARGRDGLGPPLSIETTSGGATGTVLPVKPLFSDSASDSKVCIMEGDGEADAKMDSVTSSVETGARQSDGIGDIFRSEMGSVHASMGSDAVVERKAEPGRVAFSDATQGASPGLEMTRPDAPNEEKSKLATASAGGDPISDGATGANSKLGKSEAASQRGKESKAAATSAADTSCPRGTPLPWREGDLVVLRSRFGKGQNKLGGVARVLSVFEDGTTNVKLVLGPSRPQRVPADLLSPCDQDLDGAKPSSRRKNYQASRPANPSAVRPPTRGDDKGKVEGTTDADLAAETTPAACAGVQSSAKLGDRAKVLYDSTDWYLGTVVAIRRGSSVTIRFDDGSEERVTLCPGDAELCADDAVVSSGGEDTTNIRSDRHAEAANMASKVRSARDGGARAGRTRDDARVSDASGSANKDHRGLVLTEGRAKALLDTVPEKLVGLTFQEFHRGYGGWWEMTITHVSPEKVEDNVRDVEDINPHWPESVMAEQVDPSGASPGSCRVRRKVGLLLSRLRAWDKQRELLANEAAKREARRATRSPPPRGKSPRASSKEASGAAQEAPAPVDGEESGIGRCRAEAGRATAAKNAASLKKQTPSEVTAGEADRANCSSEPSTSSTTRSKPRLFERRPRRREGSDHRGARETSSGGKDAGMPPESLESPSMASAIAEEDIARVHLEREKSAGQAIRDVVEGIAVKEKPPGRRVSAKQRASSRSTACPLYGHVGVDSHLTRCSQEMATAAGPTHVGMMAGSASPVETRTETSSASVNPARAIAIQIPAKTAVQMPSGISNMLAIGTSGDDLGTIVAAVQEFSERDICPNQKLCDRVVQEILRSRCHFRTEFLRRFMAESLATFPDCWRPLNWDRFEECLQRIGGERDLRALSAHVVAVGLMLDCVERHRQKYSATCAGSPLAPLFVGSGGGGDGREALKKCARWAAKTWARRSGYPARGDVIPSQLDIEARACHTVARALCEATECFIAAGSGTEGSAQRMETEGCQLIAIEVEAHCGELPGELLGTGSGAAASSNCGESAVEDAARCRAGLLTAIAGRRFRPRLAGILLENMQEQGGGSKGVEKLRTLLCLARGDRSPSVGVGRSRGKRDAGMRGSCNLYADLQT